jgi:hypothetical protein
MQDKAKTGEKAELTLVNEHFESVFNAGLQSAELLRHMDDFVSNRGCSLDVCPAPFATGHEYLDKD